MTISKEVLDELLKGCERPENLLGDAGLMKELKINHAYISRVLPSAGDQPGQADGAFPIGVVRATQLISANGSALLLWRSTVNLR
jgi:hypothetical protein